MGWYHSGCWSFREKRVRQNLCSSLQIMTIQVFQEGVGTCSFVPWTSVAAVESNCEVSISSYSSCFSRSSSRPLKYHTRMHELITSLRRSEVYEIEVAGQSHRQPIREASRCDYMT
ncbi:hypothetical protein ARMGADRAFT_783011 [Armillaria gallica]|uniref:Uncharacterized protein n=1 Tax=Armillaria gallica TaxID=47427 RepID=A0A2H3CYT8_ARMGA|nr:hypothetical protein ARMGADRAFT_783011 [Armillaria gallica]